MFNINKRLKREKIVKLTEDFIKQKENFEIFKIPNKLYLDYFDKIKDTFRNYHFEEDKRFVTYGRLDFLKEELTQRLNDENLKKESPNWKDKWDNRMGAFIDLWDYIRGDRYIAPHHVPDGKSFKDILLANDQYYKDGVICKQERDLLLEMIDEIKSFIENKQESKECEMNNKSKKLIFKIEDHNWGQITASDWHTLIWNIYDDLSVEYEIIYGQNKTESHLYFINEKELKLIIQNIELAKSDNRVIDAFDGNAWKFVQYEDDNVVWERKLGYIYGIASLENVSNILFDSVKTNSDTFVNEEMEENTMGLFSKKNKYDIDEKDNRPQIVYGIPDSLRKQWEKEEQEKNVENKKYDIQPEENMPREVYGIPDFIRNKDKYEIKPEDNVPQKVYGVPNNMSNSKYDIKPENNVPQRVYGIPNIMDINARKCPYCGSIELWKYLYGEPTYDYDRDKYVLGGCEITGNQPTHKCKKCGKDIYSESKLFTPNDFKLPKKEKQLIKIGIKNDKSNYVLLFNKYSDQADFVFGDINNLNGKVIGDISTNIPISIFDEFYNKLISLINNWNESYNGTSLNYWSIKIETKETNKLISGNGGFPNNWNQFIDFLVEYEMLFKKKKNADIEEIEDMKNEKLTFKEVVSKKVKDPFFVDLITKYFIEEEKMTEVVAKICFKDLSKYDDILNEFTKYLSQRTYDLKDALNINGYTAKQISELNKSFKPSGVYSFMELLRDNPTKANQIIKSGFATKDSIPPIKTNNE